MLSIHVHIHVSVGYVIFLHSSNTRHMSETREIPDRRPGFIDIQIYIFVLLFGVMVHSDYVAGTWSITTDWR